MLQQRTVFFTLVALVFALGATAGARTEIDRTGTWKVTFSSAIGDHENGDRVFDNTTNTKWLTAGGQTTGWVQYDFSEEEAYVIDNYTITSANDAPDRTCRDWTLEGSDDGTNWSILDSQVNQSNWSTFETRAYSFLNTTAYKMYKLNVTANNGSGNLMGFSEMKLREGTVDRTDRPETITFSTQLSERESAYNAFDNSLNTKWLTTQSTGRIGFQFAAGEAYAINGYAITSAGDAPNRDPKHWTLEGSNNGSTWTVLDSRTDQSWGERLQRRLFEFTNTTPYAYYRLDVTANNGDGLMGFAELELLEIVDDPAVTSMAPGNWQSTSADPVVLSWDSVRMSGAGTYTVHFGTDPNFVGADAVAVTGLTETEYTVPAEWITDDTVYYWQVDIVDDPYGVGTTTFAGPVVKFRVLRQVQKVLEWTMDSYGEGTEYDYEIPIRNVTATASSQEQGNRSPDRTVGQWGLSVDPTIFDPNGLTHSTNATQMWICNPDQAGTVWIQYAFDQAYPLGTMHVWNHNVGEPWLVELNRGMRNVIVSYSTDGTTWTNLGAYEIPQGTGQPGMPPSIAIAFGGIEAQYVRISAAATNSNWGADRNFHALSEVRFGLYNQPAVSYVMADTSGNGNDGMTYVDPQLVSEAITGTAIDLDGNDQVFMPYDPNAVSVTLPLGADEDCYESWSMNFYAMLPERSPNLAFFVGFGDFETGTGRYIAQFADGIHFWGGHNVDGITNVDFDLNRWQMITTTYEGGTLRIYKNGQEILSQATELGTAIPRVAVSGSTPWGTSAIVGLIDEFAIYRGALSPAEIAQLAAAMPTQYSALNPVPADGAANVGIDPILSWDAPRDAIEPTYDVYLGTDESSLPRVASDLTATELDTLTLPAPLAYGTTYYWYVDTHNGDVSATWSFTTMPATSAATLALGWDFDNLTAHPQEYEQAIEDVAVTASSQEADWRRAELAANGIGLIVDPTIPDANGIGLGHTNRADNMWICDPDQAGDVWIQFGFDQSYPLGTMLVWNHNVGEPWTAELNRGMRRVTVSYADMASTDPNDWTALGVYDIPMGTGLNNMPPSIGIDFGGIEAQYVRITAADATIDPNSNWGAAGNHHALSEVRFGIYGTTATAYTVPDTSGNGNAGMPYGTPEFVGGLASGQCVKVEPEDIYGFYDHIDARIENAAALPLGADDAWSMNFYVNLASNPSSPTLFAGFGATDIGTGRWVGRFNGVHFWGGNNIDVSSSRQYRYGQWQMVTATYSGTQLHLYLNGELLASGSPSGFVDAAERVSIAGWNPWGNHMNGLVDDFMLYRGVLTRGEIAALAAALPMAGDMDWNGTVEVADLPVFVLDWLEENLCTSPSDLTGDCRVDMEDFAVMAENWLSVQ